MLALKAFQRRFFCRPVNVFYLSTTDDYFVDKILVSFKNVLTWYL